MVGGCISAAMRGDGPAGAVAAGRSPRRHGSAAVKHCIWLVLICLSATPCAQAAELKVATWNLNWLTERAAGDRALPADVHPRRQEDFDRLRQYALQLDADLVALQEVDGRAAALRVFSSDRYSVHLTHERRVQRVGVAVRRGLNYDVNPTLQRSRVIRRHSSAAGPISRFTCTRAPCAFSSCISKPAVPSSNSIAAPVGPVLRCLTRSRHCRTGSPRVNGTQRRSCCSAISTARWRVVTRCGLRCNALHHWCGQMRATQARAGDMRPSSTRSLRGAPRASGCSPIRCGSWFIRRPIRCGSNACRTTARCPCVCTSRNSPRVFSSGHRGFVCAVGAPARSRRFDPGVAAGGGGRARAGPLPGPGAGFHHISRFDFRLAGKTRMTRASSVASGCVTPWQS